MHTCIGDIATEGIPYIIAEDSRIVEVNALFQSLTGYAEKDILNMGVEEIWKGLLRITADYDKVKHCHECDCYIFDMNRIVKEVVIRYYEIPESKQCIYTFQQKRNIMFEEKYPFLELVNSVSDTGIALYSVPDFVLLKANNEHFKYFAKSYPCLEDILGLRIEDVMPSWKNSESYDIFTNAVRSGQLVFIDEKRIEFPGIGDLYLSYTLTPVSEDGRVKYMTLTHNDVTEKALNKQAVLEKNHIIEEQRDHLYKLFNSLDLPILYLTFPDLKVIEVNNKVLEVLKEIAGMEDKVIEADIIGRALSEVLPVIKNYDERGFLGQLNQTKSTICHEKKEINSNGRKAYYDIIYHPILNLKGDISELLVTGVDVTAEVEKNKQMEDIIKLKDDFLYLMSHEFKAPLTVINAAVQSIEHIYSDQIPEKAKILIGKIKQNAYRQLRLVNNLLDITRINSGQIKLRKRNIDIVLLARVITESVAIYAQQKGVEIIFSSRLRNKLIGVDDEKFERILLNLLSNAIKFTPPGKKVVVELSTKLHKNKRMICLKVKDQGIGIPKDKQELIFEQFGQVDSLLTRQAEGTGIGLYLVKLMVEACNGEIYLESEEDKGSVFVLMLPSNKAKEDTGEHGIQHMSDSRLVQSLATEFSNIYL